MGVARPICRQALEEQCIQDLMYHAVHASRAPGCRLARLLYQLLHHLHGQRRHRETAEMLVRLYQPILWRALSVSGAGGRLMADGPRSAEGILMCWPCWSWSVCLFL